MCSLKSSSKFCLSTSVGSLSTHTNIMWSSSTLWQRQHSVIISCKIAIECSIFEGSLPLNLKVHTFYLRDWVSQTLLLGSFHSHSTSYFQRWQALVLTLRFPPVKIYIFTTGLQDTIKKKTVKNELWSQPDLDINLHSYVELAVWFSTSFFWVSSQYNFSMRPNHLIS